MGRKLDPARLGDHLDRLYRAAWALCGSREEAEDLVQETYARLLARPRFLRNDDDLGYLLHALRNTFLNQKRTESRRLRGAYVLQRDDMNRDFADAIAVTGHWTKYGVTYAIPFRSLRTDEVANLLVAGRCISVDHRTHHATKEIPPSMATGEAAGMAAAMAVQRGVALADLPIAALRDQLRAAGAIVDRPA
jgi:hypothetical protein